MSRYFILLILNTPFIVATLVNTLISYKLGRISSRRLMSRTTLWVLVFIGLASAKPIYEFLFSNNLTSTEPLSLFDVIQITGIVIVFFVANRSHTKIERLERRVQDLHQELSIRLAKDK